MNKQLRFVLALVMSLSWGGTARAQGTVLIYQHSGTADPVTEAWANPTCSGVTDSVSDGGIKAWTVNDTSSVGGCLYVGALTPDQRQRATAGWTLRARLRLPQTPEFPGGSPMILYRDGNVSFQLHLGSNPNGDPLVRLFEGGTYSEVTLPGAGPGYHLYEVEYDHASQVATFRIDGVVLHTNYAGYQFQESAANVAWGAGSSADTGQADFALVEFYVADTIAVEPSTWGRVKALYQ